MTDPNEQTELTEADKRQIERDLIDAFKQAHPIQDEED